MINPYFWLKSWKINHIDPLNWEWQSPQWPYPGHWARSCSGLPLMCSQGSCSSVLQSCPWEQLCLLARVGQVGSHFMHPSPFPFCPKEWQLVISISILNLKPCAPAADSCWVGYSQDVESWAALNGAFSHSVNLLQLLCCECMRLYVYIAYSTGLIWEPFIILMERRETHLKFSSSFLVSIYCTQKGYRKQFLKAIKAKLGNATSV